MNKTQESKISKLEEKLKIAKEKESLFQQKRQNDIIKKLQKSLRSYNYKTDKDVNDFLEQIQNNLETVLIALSAKNEKTEISSVD